jgi:ABC-type Fe3+ transport system permease subunit
MKRLILALLGVLIAIVLGVLWWRTEIQRRSLPCPPWLAWLLENPFMIPSPVARSH